MDVSGRQVGSLLDGHGGESWSRSRLLATRLVMPTVQVPRRDLLDEEKDRLHRGAETFHNSGQAAICRTSDINKGIHRSD
jgi:hypothetical protein